MSSPELWLGFRRGQIPITLLRVFAWLLVAAGTVWLFSTPFAFRGGRAGWSHGQELAFVVGPAIAGYVGAAFVLVFAHMAVWLRDSGGR